MSIAAFFYPRRITSIISWTDLGWAALTLAGLVSIALCGQHIFCRTWGLRYWKLAVAVWLLIVGLALANRFANDLMYPGRFIHGLKLENGYVVTTDNTPVGYAGHRATGFRINLVHSRKAEYKTPRGRKVFAEEFDYVRHLWVNTNDYMILVHLINKYNLPYPTGNPPMGLKQ